MNVFPQLRRSLRTLGVPARTRHLLVAVSGGADSVALLCALHHLAPALKLELTVAHLHHGLRGAEADADARFVRALSKRLGVPCKVSRARVAQTARARGDSVEMAGRAARYAYFSRLATTWSRRVGAPVAVATAHNRDDQAETVLLRLARGAGLRGLAGIPPERMDGDTQIVRPLLGVRRRAIEAYLRQAGQTWREDRSNTDRAMRRNRVRHDVIPLLAETLNPRIVETLAHTAEVLRAEVDRRAARAAQVDSAAIALTVPGRTRVPELGVAVEICEGHAVIRDHGQPVGALPARASLAWARLGRRKLVVRAWRAGDRMAPFGMAGHKKLQDIFVDAKVPLERRDQIPVFACGDEIVWVPGYRIARGWEITRPGERILELRVTAAVG